MKDIVKLLVLSVLMITLTGCGSDEGSASRVNSGNSVDQVINEQIENAQPDSGSEQSESESVQPDDGNAQSDNVDTMEDIEENITSESLEETSASAGGDVDYDLTTMGSDMVYAMVYQMMVSPDDYIGKTFRIDGLYYASYYEPTNNFYHYCIIPDAAACCTQGLEFVWEDGTHVYPDEYPEEYATVVIEGTFDTYKEDGDDYLYCRLIDATMDVKAE